MQDLGKAPDPLSNLQKYLINEVTIFIFPDYLTFFVCCHFVSPPCICFVAVGSCMKQEEGRRVIYYFIISMHYAEVPL